MIISLRDAKYYRASPDNTETIEIPATGWRGEYITTCVIYASLLTAGVKAFPCGNGDDVKLTASQHLSVLEYLKEQREALRGAGPKTLAGWHRTGLNIEDYLLPGDAVDDDMVDHFRDILPPLCNRHDLMQASGPFSSEKDDAGRYRDTYITFDRAADGGWRYAGLCYAGEAKNRVAYKSSLDSLIEAARAALVAQGGYCGGNVKEKAHD